MGSNSGLNTADGEDIFLYTDTTNNNVVYGKTSPDVVVFAAYLEETGSPVTGAKIWTVQYEAISNPDATNADDPVDLTDKVFVSVSQDTEFNLADAPSGQNLFLMFTNGHSDDRRWPDFQCVDHRDRQGPRQPVRCQLQQHRRRHQHQHRRHDQHQQGRWPDHVRHQQPDDHRAGRHPLHVRDGCQGGRHHSEPRTRTRPTWSRTSTSPACSARRRPTSTSCSCKAARRAQVRISAFSTAVESGNSFIEGYAGDTTVSITSVRVLDSAGNVLGNLLGRCRGRTEFDPCHQHHRRRRDHHRRRGRPVDRIHDDGGTTTAFSSKTGRPSMPRATPTPTSTSGVSGC